MPEVSIITPVYADQPEKVAWLAEAVGSVLTQSFTDWELIVVDDCSPLSLELPGDGRVRRFRTTRRRGPATCRNTAAALAEADALLALDADDRLAEGALEAMHAAWRADPKRVVYGDLQRLVRSGNDFHEGKKDVLPDYTFELALKLSGIIPVTAMHSYECHQRSGGWKPTLEFGLEDVEYWISAGKAGFCGHHLPQVTLLYRKHETSRSFGLRHLSRMESAMRQSIREMHTDVYNGRYPMGCCGGGGGSSAPPASAGNPAPAVTTLDQYPATEKIWVQYTGRRSASFGMVGSSTGITYQVHGPDHKFEIHVTDVHRFRRSGRGKDFAVGVSPPAGHQPEPEQPAGADEPAYEPPPPELAEIERLDAVASRRRTEPPDEPQGPRPLDGLGLGALQDVLELEAWTPEKLARAEPDELIGYKGIGPVRAGQIINRARELTNG